jgi:hypothetical protein
LSIKVNFSKKAKIFDFSDVTLPESQFIEEMSRSNSNDRAIHEQPPAILQILNCFSRGCNSINKLMPKKS